MRNAAARALGGARFRSVLVQSWNLRATIRGVRRCSGHQISFSLCLPRARVHSQRVLPPEVRSHCPLEPAPRSLPGGRPPKTPGARQPG
eukprot:3771058-Pyramimonas_sp.AAC.1